MMQQNALSQAIAEFIDARAQAKLEKFDKDAEKQRKELSGDALAAFEQTVALSRAESIASYKPDNWLTDAASRAKQISLVTHAIKFTHSDAKGTSVFAKSTSPQKVPYLTTASLGKVQVDVVGNAAALDVAGLLQIEVNGTPLVSAIAEGNIDPFRAFAKSEEQAEEWLQGFKAALADKELSSHKLAKQLYFPVEAGSYHLLSPLYSSALSQELYERVAAARFSEEAKAARKARRDEKYHANKTVDFPNIAVQTFGGTKPQNISLLNSKRGGKTYLLSCQPPTWQVQRKPPSHYKEAFWHEFDRRAWRTAKALKDFLIKVIARDSTRDIRNIRANYVDELIDILLQYAAEIQQMKDLAGWSAGSALPLAEQLWLDPLRSDTEFQQKRATLDWPEEIAKRFAGWLNHKLKDDQLLMADVEYREWLTECVKELY